MSETVTVSVLKKVLRDRYWTGAMIMELIKELRRAGGIAATVLALLAAPALGQSKPLALPSAAQAAPSSWDSIVVGMDTLHTAVVGAVSRQWSLLYREFATEFLQCLYGTVQRDEVRHTLTVIVIIAPLADLPPSLSKPTAVGDVNRDDCPWTFQSWRYLGKAHSHPGAKPSGGPSAECYLGKRDYEMLQGVAGVPTMFLSIVVCGQDRYMIFTRYTGYMGTLCIYDPEALANIACRGEEKP